MLISRLSRSSRADADLMNRAARARVSWIQWCSLSSRLNPSDSLSQSVALSRFESIRRSPACDDNALRQYLVNGWTTESLLIQNRNSFSGEALKNSLVWAFPQAYYSVYAITLAYFQTCGLTVGKTHASLIRKVGDEIHAGNYPYQVSFLASGGIAGERTFLNCKHNKLPNTLFFDSSPDTVDTHIANSLNATRQSDLRDRLMDYKLKTLTGRPKTRFSKREYRSASKNLGHTSFMSFLYRKRIKTNYRDIESIIAPELNADDIFSYIIQVVNCLHLIHEAYIAQALGFQAYKTLCDSVPTVAAQPTIRLGRIKPYL
jgi:hypothetical protein